jgi:hypothetical protein
MPCRFYMTAGHSPVFCFAQTAGIFQRRVSLWAKTPEFMRNFKAIPRRIVHVITVFTKPRQAAHLRSAVAPMKKPRLFFVR